MVRAQCRRGKEILSPDIRLNFLLLFSELHIYDGCVELVNALFELGAASPKNLSTAS